MPDDPLAWLAEAESHGPQSPAATDDPPRRGRTWMVVAGWLAGIACGAALGLGAVAVGAVPAPGSARPPAPSGPPAAPPSPAPGAPGTPSRDGAHAADAHGAHAADAHGAHGAASGVPAADRDGTLAALAAVTVRLSLTDAGGQERPARYVDLATAESVTRVGEVVIVTVAAVVLEGVDGRWESVRPARYALALTDGEDGPAVADGPWPLPPGPLGAEATAVPAVPVEEPPLEAGVDAALRRAGYDDVAVEAVGRAPDLPGVVVATVVARGPGERERVRRRLWLSDDPRPHLLGGSA